MTTPVGAKTEPFMRLRTGQKVLATLVVVLLLALGLCLADAARVRNGSSYASGSSESARTNAVYTMREGLNVSLSLQRYLTGAAPRRDVQIARALLAQRLAVRDSTGITAGSAVAQRVPDFPVTLNAVDEFVDAAPSGILPLVDRVARADQGSSLASNLASASRRVGDIESTDFKAEVAANQAVSDELQADLLRSLVLLVASLLAGGALVGWLMSDMRRAVVASRLQLADEQAELARLRDQALRPWTRT